MSKKITIITPFFYPEDTAIGLYTSQFSNYLTDKGYTVNVLTGFPNYPNWKIKDSYKNLPSFYTEIANDVEIIRYKQYIPSKVTSTGRILMMLSLLYGTFINLRKVKSTDLVICIVPFTILILPAMYLARRRKSKLWIHIQDFEFDLAQESGIINNKKFTSRLFSKVLFSFERYLLNAAGTVSSISYKMLEKIAMKSKNKNPYFFPNWVSSEKINPNISNVHSIINPGKFTLLYSGNIGEKQDWDFLQSLCAIIDPHDNIEITVVGNGAYKNTLIDKLSDFYFVKFHDPVPYEELNDLLCSANVHFLFQKTDVVDTLMPSKILAMMASERPSVISGNKNSEVGETMRKSEGGYYFSENDPNIVYRAIVALKNDPALCSKMGFKARAYVLNKFSEQAILERFENKIKSLFE